MLCFLLQSLWQRPIRGRSEGTPSFPHDHVHDGFGEPATAALANTHDTTLPGKNTADQRGWVKSNTSQEWDFTAEAHDWDQSSSINNMTLSLSLSTVAPILSSGSGPQITRSSSIPANDMGYELYGTSPLGSSLSLADRPKSMMRSGSFREPSEDGEPWALTYSSIWCNMHKCFI